jgi:hypothetical protein
MEQDRLKQIEIKGQWKLTLLPHVARHIESAQYRHQSIGFLVGKYFKKRKRRVGLNVNAERLEENEK